MQGLAQTTSRADSLEASSTYTEGKNGFSSLNRLETADTKEPLDALYEVDDHEARLSAEINSVHELRNVDQAARKQQALWRDPVFARTARSARFKLDMHVIPALLLLWLANFIDRSNAGNGGSYFLAERLESC